jgi:metal-responsive CopG/Arc/MetJ family transcriptional regulator
MARLSVSIPEELSEQLRRIQRAKAAKLSHVIADALREYFSKHYIPAERGARAGTPTVLWKLKAAGRLSLRSPKLSEIRVSGAWVVEEY